MKKIIISILVVAVIIGVVIYLKNDSKTQIADNQILTESNQNAPVEATPTPTPISDPNVKTFTMAEVAAHGSDFENYQGCWTVINGKVYDITEYADTFKHPGGEMIYQACGKDGIALFETRPEGSGTPHSPAANKILEKYYIGDLKK